MGTDNNSTTMTQNEMNSVNVFIKELVSQAGFNPAAPLSDD